jgi:hypothetical protein
MTTEHRHVRFPRWLIPVVGGLVLTTVGAALLADRLGYHLPHRWAFLVLLAPAAAAIVDGVRLAQHSGWLSVAVISRLVAAALFTAIAVLLFLELDTGVILPVLIVALGLGTIVRAWLRQA